MLRNKINDFMNQISIAELSRRLGLSYPGTNNILKKEDLSTVSAGNLVGIAEILDVEVERLYIIETYRVDEYIESCYDSRVIKSLFIDSHTFSSMDAVEEYIESRKLSMLTDELLQVEKKFEPVLKIAVSTQQKYNNTTTKEENFWSFIDISENVEKSTEVYVIEKLLRQINETENADVFERSKEILEKHEIHNIKDRESLKFALEEIKGGLTMELKKNDKRLYEDENRDNFIIDSRGFLHEYTGHDPLIIIPDEVVEIGSEVFKGKGVEGVIFNDKLKFIGISAFEDNNIQILSLPANVKVVGTDAFKNNKIEKILFPEENLDYKIFIFGGAFKENRIRSIKFDKKKVIQVGAFDGATHVNNSAY